MKKIFYQKNWFSILMILLFFPLGYYLYYKYHTAKPDTKGGVFLVSLILFAIALPFHMITIFLIYIPFVVYMGLIGKQSEALKKGSSQNTETKNSSIINFDETDTIYPPESQINRPYQQNTSIEFQSSNDLERAPLNDMAKSKSTWISPGTSTTVHGYTIPDGMIYVGHGLMSISNTYNSEAAFIDPRLPVQKNAADYINTRAGYWPSYIRITPEERASYLYWLSTGKCDPNADIGYVFLYFYGLERRLIHDIPNNPILQPESELLQSEVKRLLSIYGVNRSFHNYATSLLSYIEADISINNTVYNQQAPEPTYHQGLPSILKLGICQMARDQVSLPADWALSWYLSTYEPPIYTRTTAQRCYIEFKNLFEQKYKNKYADGMKMKPNKTMLSCEYQPASSSLNCVHKETNLPDITRTKRYLNNLAPLIQECHDALDKYSRFIGRNPDKSNTIDALLSLPVSVWPDNILQKFMNISNEINASSAQKTMSFSEFLDKIPLWGNQTKAKMTTFLNILENNFHVNMEPDCRINGKVPNLDSDIVLFFQNQQVDMKTFSDPQYAFASLVIHLMSLVMQVDGTGSSEERELLINQIDKWTWIDQNLKPRLKAHAIWMRTQIMNMNGIKKRVEGLDASQKNLIATLLIQISQADGKISIEELKFLEKIFKILELDTKALYNQMNQSSFEPVTVSIGTQRTSDFTIAPPPASNPEELQLDMDKVSALKADSERVASLLSEIFSSENDIVKATQPTEFPKKCKDSSSLWNLSSELSQFVYHIIEKPAWTLMELEELATEHGMMLDGSLEEINDAAFDTFDEALIEDTGDIFEINQDIVRMISK